MVGEELALRQCELLEQQVNGQGVVFEKVVNHCFASGFHLHSEAARRPFHCNTFLLLQCRFLGRCKRRKIVLVYVVQESINTVLDGDTGGKFLRLLSLTGPAFAIRGHR